MGISVLHNIAGVKKATGLTVVIDVFRAFSTACYVFANGAEKIIPVGDIEIAYKLKRENPNFVLMGERNGFIQPGFDFGNSPFQIRDIPFKGKTVVHTTTAGTQGIANAVRAHQILTGSFVNAGAITRYIQRQNPKQISLVCTGTANEHVLDEDAVCAEWIKNSLLNKPNDFKKVVEHLKSAGFANHFFNPNIKSHPIEDFDLCMSLDKFDFVLLTEQYKDLFQLKKVSVS